MKFNVSVLNRLNGFFVNTKYRHKHNAIFNKTVTRLAPILTKCFFPYLTLQATLNLHHEGDVKAKGIPQKLKLDFHTISKYLFVFEIPFKKDAFLVPC